MNYEEFFEKYREEIHPKLHYENVKTKNKEFIEIEDAKDYQYIEVFDDPFNMITTDHPFGFEVIFSLNGEKSRIFAYSPYELTSSMMYFKRGYIRRDEEINSLKEKNRILTELVSNKKSKRII